MEDEIDLKKSIKAFYKIDGMDIENEEIKIEPEGRYSIIDVLYKGKKFQIKNVPGKFKEKFSLMEKGKKEIVSVGCNNFEEFKEKYIKEQLREPVSGSEVILLLWANSPFLIDCNQESIMQIINNDEELLDLSKKSGYEEIYLLDSDKKIKVFSKG